MHAELLSAKHMTVKCAYCRSGVHAAAHWVRGVLRCAAHRMRSFSGVHVTCNSSGVHVVHHSLSVHVVRILPNTYEHLGALLARCTYTYVACSSLSVQVHTRCAAHRVYMLCTACQVCMLCATH